MRNFIILGVALLASCGSESSNNTDALMTDLKVIELQGQVEALSERVEDEHRFDPKPPRLSMQDTGFSVIDSGLGPLSLQLLKIEDAGNGVNLRLRVGNPSAATITKWTINGGYGKLDASREPVGKAKWVTIEVDDDLHPGTWTEVVLRVDGPTSADFGYLEVYGLHATNMTLTRAS